ncbi:MULTISPECIES: lysine exporter LysO family protein [Halomonas]|uniref:lysine exporter LysO family protein n=1 Tax=Halomonas TaxID=2745 RepID=UPI001A903FD2|nr:MULTISPECIES: lysine exporter LysO family protein [Halomonas]MED5295324.1 lysine exporter LysO family protein [Pseudomonadota bacterium]MBN8411531.1 lysine exporter LysO family protein [Halomonas litopenaei]MBY5923956.1 lysine exporter LysO family protein [Halomonas sp. DP4Y7-2]MBY5928107.1 lysine exporter LysO family protein [Halomonas sp. DP8Y7-3]MBY6208549.1 lysine exporter LysO family protein [Halomonas sp. DP3Y7-2]
MFSGLLIVLLPLVLGYLIPVRSAAVLGWINRGVSASIYLILLLMGISLAGLPDLGNQLSRMGGQALTLFSVISLFNLAALWWLSRRLRLDLGKRQVVEGAPTSKLAAMAGSLALVGVVVAGLVLGLLLVGRWGATPFQLAEHLAEWVLYLLLALIGCQLRNSGMPLKQILLNRHGLYIALTLATSSLLGGLAAAPLLDLEWNEGLAMASGFGWYSLSGILIGEHLGPALGGVAFFNDLTRELLAFVLIPLVMRRYAPLAIGYGGATSMDFTLPVIQQHGGVRCVPIAVVSGFLLSLLSPPLILFLVSL